MKLYIEKYTSIKRALHPITRYDRIEGKGVTAMLQINSSSLYPVLRDFYTLTNLRIVIFDTQFQELMAYPEKRVDFCSLLRQKPEGETACRKSDRDGCKQCAKTKELVLYRCHAGLTEAVVPILDTDGVLAYVMFGQVLPRENGNSAKGKLKSNYPAFSDYIDRIPVKSAAELNAAATVLQAITTYVITNRWVTPGKSAFIRQLDRYIEENLRKTISVEEVCAAFHIGRTRLYALSSDYLGCGLAEYIRNQRIFHAQKLLTQTEMPITEIASAVGFCDYNHFSRIFKQVTGSSAREYRNSRQ